MPTATRAGIRRFALVALLALAAQALVPYLHANASAEASGRATHSADCAVCSALAHGGARAFHAPAAIHVSTAPVALVGLAPAPLPFVALLDADTACARAPPASLLA